ncbi:C25 family cysteine peptidase [uncultured Fibrella sp.]|uniref:putative type IX secretion system sortase PorU2 n=1 Tax=uncultured Fibrella sp. TaxID=1284596 RepID=UPI0035CA348B
MRLPIYSYLFILLFSFTAKAQKTVFGTEWINYQQTYYKIPVAQKGLYRITANDLQKAGLPLTGLNPKTLQLFHRGVEQAILVEGEADGKFDTADYIEFIGKGNDGTQDSALYRPASAQPHPYYSLYSDTTAYFLTTRLDGLPGKRMTSYTDLDAAALTPQPYIWAEELRVFTDQYPAGNIYPIGAGYSNGAILTAYDVGEGWMSNSIKAQTRYEQAITLTKVLSTSLATPTLTMQYIGRTPTAHSVQVQVGQSARPRTLDMVKSVNYDPYTLTIPLSATDVADGGRVICSLSPQVPDEEVSMAYLRAEYPHQTDLAGYSYREFKTNAATGGRALLRLTSVPITGRVFDITTPGQTSVLSGTLVASTLTSGTWTSVVREASVPRNLLMVSTSLPVLGMQRVAFRNINPAKASFLIVTHPALRAPTVASPDAVAEYAAYRASKAGGSYDTLTVTINQLFNQFSYGERNAVAIRRFIDYISRNGSPRALLLVGQSRDPQGVRKNPLASSLDMVPSGGWPGSDLALVTGLNGRPEYVPAVAVGRLNVTQPQQVLDYLNKVKEHESAASTALWRKKMLHLSGGRSAYELNLFRAFVDEFATDITRKYVSASVETVSKRTDDPVENIPIVDQVNKGIGMISMFGHSSLDVADIDIGYVSNDRLGYRNKGRYPLLLANGCASGNFYFGPKTFVSDWVLTPDRGAILALAHTYNGFASALKTYTDNLYSVMTDSTWYAKPFGDIQVEAIRRYMLVNNSIYDKTNAEQITLQGDPAVRLFPFSRPDLTFSDGGIRVVAQPNSVSLTAVVLNLGRGMSQRPEVRVRQYAASGQLLQETRQPVNAATYSDTLRISLPVTTLAGTFFEFYADADARFDEERKDNNVLQVKSDGQLANLPFDVDNTAPVVEVAFDGRRILNDAFVAPQPMISVLIADENTRLFRTDPTGLELYLQRPCAQQPCAFEKLTVLASNATWSNTGGTFRLNYRPAQPLPDGVYTLEVYGSDLSGNRAQPYAIRFVVKQEAVVQAITVAPNPFAYQTTIRYVLTGSQTPQPVTLHLFDLAGREVRTIQLQTVVGTNEFVWDGTNDTGTPMAAGSYLYRLDIPGYDAFADTAKKQLTGRIILAR